MRSKWAFAACPAAGGACLGAFFFLSAVSVAAQTVRPIIGEYVGKARGRFEIVNETLFPLNVVLEPKSFSVSEDGQPRFRPLDANIHLKLSSMSFRLPPQQTFFVFYEATAERLPNWFTIYCSFSGLPRQAGVNVVVDLPHTVYLYQKESLHREEVRMLKVEYRPDSKQVAAEVENTSEHLGRAVRVEVRGGRRTQAYSGFPLLPKYVRRLLLNWEGDNPPERLILRFRNFNVEGKLEGARR